MKNKMILGLVIGFIAGSLITYFYLTFALSVEYESDFDPMNDDPYEHIAKGFKIEYRDSWNDGRPFEEQELAFLRDMDFKNHEETFDPTKLSVINYWASFCGPCLMEIPELIKLKEEYKEKANFYAVFPEKDQRKRLMKIIDKTGFNYIQVTDQFNEKNTRGGIYPTTIILDMTKGALEFQKIGMLEEGDFQKIKSIIDKNVASE